MRRDVVLRVAPLRIAPDDRRGREHRSDSRFSLGFAAVLIAGAAASVAWTMFLGWAVAKFVGARVMLRNAGVSFLIEYWPSLVLAVLVVVLMVLLRRASGRISRYRKDTAQAATER